MTAINATITPRRAYISADRSNYYVGPGGMPPEDVTAAQKPQVSRRLPDVTKVRTYSDKRMIATASGSLVLAESAFHWLAEYATDIEHVALEGPEVFGGLLRDSTEHTWIHEMIVIVAGYSAARERVIGYAFDYRQHFAPITLDRGTTQMPAASPDMPGYDRLYRHSQQAGKGKKVRAFHEALHANQIAQFRAGRLRAGGMISDAFDMAAVDVRGARIDR